MKGEREAELNRGGEGESLIAMSIAKKKRERQTASEVGEVKSEGRSSCHPELGWERATWLPHDRQMQEVDPSQPLREITKY